MSNRYHYDQNGGYRGHSSNTPPVDSGIVVLIILAAIAGGIYWLWMSVTEWYLLDVPYRQVAFFYNYTIVAFLKGIAYVFLSLLYNWITPFPNLNFVLGVVLGILGSLAYIAGTFWVVVKSIVYLDSKGIAQGLIVLLYFAPFLFILGWFPLSSIFSWLFS